MYLKTLILFSVISLTHCCGKQTPPNFGVPVFKAPESRDENYTAKKDILIRDERSVTGRYRHKNTFYYNLEGEDTPSESSHSDVEGNENSHHKSQSAILNVIRIVLSDSGYRELTQNRDVVPSKQKSKTNNVQKSHIQLKNSTTRIRRDASQQEVMLTLSEDETQQQQEEENVVGRGWDATAAIPGFVFAAAMLVGVTCFIR